MMIANDRFNLLNSTSVTLAPAGDLFVELTDASCENLRTSASGRKFCAIWNGLGISINATSNINNVVGQKLPLFYILTFTWDNMLNDPDLNLQEILGEDDYNSIRNTITEIKQALNE